MGPLSGLRIVEMAGIGPIPHIGMMLSDMGAEVIRIDRPVNASSYGANPGDITGRGRKSLGVNLKDPDGVETVLQLLESSDILFEGMRPGVMEKLGLGPDVCLARNPKLVYGRMTGWGQEGPYAQMAGHDINYIGITGALNAIGSKDGAPIPPLNLVGDFGGGAMYMLVGLLAAYIEAQTSNQGQVVDAAISDGVINLLSCVQGLRAIKVWDRERGDNILDGGAPYYGNYECADGRWITLGSIEPQFYLLMWEKLGLAGTDDSCAGQYDKSMWPELKAKIAAQVKQKTQAQWCEIMDGTDVCFAPVLSFDEAVEHPHNKARGCYTEIQGVTQSQPAPRFSRTQSEIQGPPVDSGANNDELLSGMGLSAEQIAELRAKGVVC